MKYCLSILLLLVLRAATAEPRALPEGQWYERLYEETVITRPLSTTPATGVGLGDWKRWVDLPLALPAGNEFFTNVKASWRGCDWLRIQLHVPPDLPPETLVYVFVKDWDDLWRHIHEPLKPTADGTVELAVPISGPRAAAAWNPRGHYRPWHQLTPDQLKEVGLKISLPPGRHDTFTGTLQLRGMLLSPAPEPTPEAAVGIVRDLRRWPQNPRVGGKLEYALALTHPYSDPFDHTNVNLVATITPPEGEPIEVPLFYYEGFLIDPADRRSAPLPAGAPEFRLRYTPLVAGTHEVRIHGRVGQQSLEIPAQTVAIGEPAEGWRGFVCRHPTDKRLLAWSGDRSEYWGVGLNVRSPYDTRYMASFPWSAWRDDDEVNLYHDLFKQYAASGINVVEVWMSPWWLALEWIPDAPGNHGIGYFNPYRAWKLDRIFTWAEECDIELILVLNNHGKFSAWCDPDWDRNPYNRANGGYLSSPQDYFGSDRARQDFRRLADYIVARWSYSPNLLAWKLFTEINLTGQESGDYTQSVVTDWHRQAARHIRQVDPNHHLVTTHWSTSYGLVNADLAALPELDFLALDIYYSGTGADQLFTWMYNTYVFGTGQHKPWIITEFGGSPYGDTIAHLQHQLHLGLWSGFFFANATTPCFWWFPMVEEQNLYGYFAGVAAFTAGENRAGATVVKHAVPDTDLIACELRRADERLVWLFDSAYYFSGRLNVVPTTWDSVDLALAGLPAGNWQVEVWDVAKGEVRETLTLTAGAAGTRLKLPAFTRDLALKLRRQP